MSRNLGQNLLRDFAPQLGRNFENARNVAQVLQLFTWAHRPIHSRPDLTSQQVVNSCNRKLKIHDVTDTCALQELKISLVSLYLNLEF